MQRASIHEQYDVGTGESASRTGDYGTGGANGRLGKAERTGTSGTGGTSGTSGTGESASQSQRMHGAGYVGAIMGRGDIVQKNFAKKL